jgi:D-alanyl-D-alanine carboxypeptidase
MRPVALVAFLLLASLSAAADEATLLEKYASELRESSDLPGLNAAVRLPDGRVVTASVGFADVENRTALTAHTRMPGGSTGKTFVAATAMQLVEEGRLDLDAPLSTWFRAADWFDELPNARDITLAMLLSHTSGLPDHVEDLGFALNAGWRRLTGDTVYMPAEELIGFLAGDAPEFPAGAGYSYTDTGYLIVGLVLERVTGHDYYDELRARILEPLDLDDVTPPTGTQTDGLAAGYVAPSLLTVVTGLAGKITNDDGTLSQILRTEWTGGGLFTTPAMLVRFYGALAQGRVVHPETVRTMIAPASGPERPYGYGIFVFEHPELGRWIGHGGWFPGFRTAVVHYLDNGVTVALQTNTDRDVDLFEAIARIAKALPASD